MRRSINRIDFEPSPIDRFDRERQGSADRSRVSIDRSRHNRVSSIYDDVANRSDLIASDRSHRRSNRTAKSIDRSATKSSVRACVAISSVSPASRYTPKNVYITPEAISNQTSVGKRLSVEASTTASDDAQQRRDAQRR